MRSSELFRYLKTAFISFIIAFTLYIPNMSVTAAANTATVTISAPMQPVSPGSQFTISIAIQPNNAIAGAQFNLSFNPSLVSVNSISEGNLLNQNGDSTYFIPGQIDDTNGTVTGVAGTITNPGQTVSAEGNFAVITMTAGSTSGTTNLTLSKVILGNVQAQSVPVSIINGSITVSGTNQPPVFNTIGDKTVNAGQLLTFTVSAADPDNDSLSYTVDNLPFGASFDGSSRSFSWTPTTGQVGTYSNVQFRVTDGTLSDTKSITITVLSQSPSGGGGGGSGAPTVSNTDSIATDDGVFKQTLDIKSEDNAAEVVIDEGTKGLTKDGQVLDKIALTKIKSPPGQPDQSDIVGAIYSIEPDGAAFDRPINLTFSYSPSMIPAGVNENTLCVSTWDPISNRWVDLESTVNPQNRTVSTKVKHFSFYCILAHTRPASFVFSDLTVQPAEAEVGSKVNINLSITNTGDLKDSTVLTLMMDDQSVGSQTVTLAGGERQTVEFTTIPQSEGVHLLSVAGLSLKLVVNPAAKDAFSISGINLSSTEVDPGEPVTVSALVLNSGAISGTDDLVMTINGTIQAEKQVTVEAGRSQEVSFDVIEQNPGTYTVDVNGFDVSFKVRVPLPATTVSGLPNGITDNAVQALTTEPQESSSATAVSSESTVKVFSLALLSEIIGGAFILIALTVFMILVRRRRLLNRVQN